jgi:hypothetical protein
MDENLNCFIADTKESTTIGDESKIVYNTLSDLSDLKASGTEIYFDD